MTQQTDPQICRIPAYAKLNLFLSVRDRREDGFHEILAVNHEITLSDSLAFSPEMSGFRITVEGNPSVPADERNLVHKAVRSLLQERPLPDVQVRIHKQIPVGAGLGGGSADAAVTMKFFNSHLRLGKTLKELILLAQAVGSDVPFALVGGTALVSGIGEKVQSLPAHRQPIWFVVASPAVMVNTSHAYRWIDEQGTGSDSAEPDELINALEQGDLISLGKQLHNSFETVVFERCPEIQRLKNSILKAGALGALMTGSGSNVFGIARSQDHAESVKKEITEDYPACWVARSAPSEA